MQQVDVQVNSPNRAGYSNDLYGETEDDSIKVNSLNWAGYSNALYGETEKLKAGNGVIPAQKTAVIKARMKT